MRRMYDAAFPPPSPPHWEAVAGYIGGDTPHVWTHADWASQPARYRLPIYVRSDPQDVPPRTDAAAAIAAVHGLGVPKGSVVALDFETAVDGAYVRAFDAEIVAAGYHTLLYGSLNTVVNNPRPSGGYWTAAWTGVPHIGTEPGVVATQFANDTLLGTTYDASLVADSVPLWDTRPAPPRPEEDDMPSGELRDGNTEPTVISWPKGKFAAIGFLADNGFQGKPPAQLRVAVHSAAGGWAVTDVTVDSAKGKATVHFAHPDTDGVSVARLDDGTVAVSWDAS